MGGFISRLFSRCRYGRIKSYHDDEDDDDEDEADQQSITGDTPNGGKAERIRTKKRSKEKPKSVIAEALPKVERALKDCSNVISDLENYIKNIKGNATSPSELTPEQRRKMADYGMTLKLYRAQWKRISEYHSHLSRANAVQSVRMGDMDMAKIVRSTMNNFEEGEKEQDKHADDMDALMDGLEVARNYAHGTSLSSDFYNTEIPDATEADSDIIAEFFPLQVHTASSKDTVIHVRPGVGPLSRSSNENNNLENPMEDLIGVS